MSLLSGAVARHRPTDGYRHAGTVVPDKIMVLCASTQPAHTQRIEGMENLPANPLLMQDEMPPWAQCRHRACLFGLAGSYRLAQGKHGSRKIKVHRFLGQHGQAL